VVWDGLTRNTCATVIGVTSDNVGLARAKEVLVSAGGNFCVLFLGSVA
jgi:hypothetical protein